jgi:hypothetical protein
MGLKLTFRLTGAISYIKSCMLRCRNPISCQLNLKLHVPDKYIDNQNVLILQLLPNYILDLKSIGMKIK